MPRGVTVAPTRDTCTALLPTADVVIIAAPHTHETRGLIGRPSSR